MYVCDDCSWDKLILLRSFLHLIHFHVHKIKEKQYNEDTRGAQQQQNSLLFIRNCYMKKKRIIIEGL